MKADYFWIIAVVAVVILVVFWKPLTGMISDTRSKMINKEQYETGKEIFFDTTRWGGEDSYKSCAMCHDPDFTPEPGKEIDMIDYKEREPIVLEGIASKYGGGWLGTSDKLFVQINRCISLPTRLSAGSYSRNAPFMDDLMLYVRRQ